jgi:hypothetical protein
MGSRCGPVARAAAEGDSEHHQGGKDHAREPPHHHPELLILGRAQPEQDACGQHVDYAPRGTAPPAPSPEKTQRRDHDPRVDGSHQQELDRPVAALGIDEGETEPRLREPDGQRDRAEGQGQASPRATVLREGGGEGRSGRDRVAGEGDRVARTGVVARWRGRGHEGEQSAAIARGHDASGAGGEDDRDDDHEDDLTVPHGGCRSPAMPSVEEHCQHPPEIASGGEPWRLPTLTFSRIMRVSQGAEPGCGMSGSCVS